MGRVLDCTGGDEWNMSTHIPLLAGYRCKVPHTHAQILSNKAFLCKLVGRYFCHRVENSNNTVPRTELTLKTKGAENPSRMPAPTPTPAASSNTNFEKRTRKL